MMELMDVVISTHGLSTTSRWDMERKSSRQEIVMAGSQLISPVLGRTQLGPAVSVYQKQKQS